MVLPHPAKTHLSTGNVERRHNWAGANHAVCGLLLTQCVGQMAGHTAASAWHTVLGCP